MHFIQRETMFLQQNRKNKGGFIMENNGYVEEKERKYDSVLTVKGMMDYLSISKTYAYQLLEKKEIPYIKFGRTYRILKEDLDKYCRQNRVKSPGMSRRS